MKLSVIIPAWNLWPLTKNCLHSLAAHTAPELLEGMEVLVVDNGSTDETLHALAPTLSTLFGHRGRAVVLPENLGFAKACNAGARAAQSPLLFFLNNDTVVTEGWLPPLLEALNHNPKTGMVGPLLLYPGGEDGISGKVQHCGIAFAPTLEMDHIYSLFPGNHPLTRKMRPLQAITGAAFLLRADIFEACGGLHEGYVNGFEDLDLCCAVREQGLRLYNVWQSRIVHITSQTPGRFTHDGPNTRLLNERRPGAFKPDLHLMGLDDGFIPCLSPCLDLYLSLTEAKETALTQAFSQAFNEERCLARLQAEPLWQGGYGLLAAYYEEQGRMEEAVEARSNCVHFFPLVEHAAALSLTAARAGDAPLAEQAKRAAQDILQRNADRAALAKKAHALSAWAREVHDQSLTQLFTAWLARIFHK